MSNLCNNTIIMKDCAQNINDFVEKIKNHDENRGIFGVFTACPQNLYNFGSLLYDWCLENWGTTWDVPWSEIEEYRSMDKQILYLNFNTELSPPIPAFLEISKHYPNANFTLAFSQSIYGTAGKVVIKNGEKLDEYVISTKWIYDECGYKPSKEWQELLDEFNLSFEAPNEK